ncbi:MAG: CRISPR-associated endonuclease Cas1 [Saprospiraceae bacterium]|nr:CRISPR-associated endonuclease Cas1 [Saprospiraceae bacterium]
MQLVIDGYGKKLSRQENAFIIFSKEGRQKLSPAKIKSIVLTQGTMLTTDAIVLAVESGIDIQVTGPAGDTVGRLWSHRFGSISTIRKGQLMFAEGPQRLPWVIEVLRTRFRQQKHFLKRLIPDRPGKKAMLEKACDQLEDVLISLEELSIDTPEVEDGTLRGWEGKASRVYFQALSRIVPEIYAFNKRSRRPALDVFNCVLNYLYGILYGRVENALIRAGLDPYVGLFHRDDYNRPVFVFDVIERYRIWAEEVLLHLCFRKALDEDMFSRKNEGYWLEREGRQLVIFAMNEHLNEVTQHHNKRRSRLFHIQEDAHAFAQKMLYEGQ